MQHRKYDLLNPKLFYEDQLKNKMDLLINPSVSKQDGKNTCVRISDGIKDVKKCL